MLLRASIALVLALSAAAVGGAQGRVLNAARDLDPREWTVGPIVRGRNYSEGVAPHPAPRRGGGWQVEIPRAPGSIHYVTFPHGSLQGKRRIVMRYRVEAAPGVRIVPATPPHGPSMITLYFQRGGDSWSGKRQFETYRWYATFATQSPVTAGERVIVAPLNGNWTAVQRSSARGQRVAFEEAVAHADQVGFVLGGGSGFGHGVYATGPARLVVTDFRVE